MRDAKGIDSESFRDILGLFFFFYWEMLLARSIIVLSQILYIRKNRASIDYVVETLSEHIKCIRGLFLIHA